MNVQFKDTRGNGTLIKSYDQAASFPGGFNFYDER
jgi:hypothetical protein